MICKAFPDLQWLKRQAESGFSNRQAFNGKSLQHEGWPSVVMNATASEIYRDNIRGPLSLFTNVAGASSVICDKKRYVIHQRFFLLTNQDQYYTLEIDQKKPTETLNIHFGKHWAEEVVKTIKSGPEDLLDEPIFSIPSEKIELYNKLGARDLTLEKILAELRMCDDVLSEEERLFSLLVHLLKENNNLKKAQANLPSLKKSTQQELLRRLLASTDYIYTFYNKDVTLDELAATACLSKFHFLRLFKIAFGKTPHQFINHVKIERSKPMLRDHKLEVSTIARSLGFQNPSSFSRMFYQNTGVYPSQFRAGSSSTSKLSKVYRL